MGNQEEISIEALAAKVGITNGPISMGGIAEKIGYTKRPITMSDLAKAVDKYIMKKDKK